MKQRLRIGVLFGGRSGEHEVSIQSAKSLMQALDPSRYEILPIGISKTGEWVFGLQAFAALQTSVPDYLANSYQASNWGDCAMSLAQLQSLVDVVFPVLHGSFGEDGTIQGMLEMLNIPYVGAGVLASAVGMDKLFMKRIFGVAGLPQCAYCSVMRQEFESDENAVISSIEREIGFPCFVKPANLGSSVGISKAKNREQLKQALETAAQYDRKLIVEEGLNVREVEVAVLGNDSPLASVPGEIVPSSEFYDYEAKYMSGSSELMIPANLPEDQSKQLQMLAIQAFQAIDGSGLARVDFFIEKETNRILINEINTMPGFTIYSMYPKLWEATGVPYIELVGRLISLALERFADKQRNVTEFQVSKGDSVNV
ncbi:D-alanine--D-alanine ligase [Fodinisporobacter ferrooxydans]|uniref:D-alanine--D-alanine ligase n=1 Tax=Fodinisporobacter ferrooxydans TaxID=2901836 RepID=A0ABY4CJA9_9BACL|nr:D-alanine--D-alanine ligase [Alicyclobacillaceae bacterium MYW30-H2]